jgi:hypothetical protein
MFSKRLPGFGHRQRFDSRRPNTEPSAALLHRRRPPPPPLLRELPPQPPLLRELLLDPPHPPPLLRELPPPEPCQDLALPLCLFPHSRAWACASKLLVPALSPPPKLPAFPPSALLLDAVSLVPAEAVEAVRSPPAGWVDAVGADDLVEGDGVVESVVPAEGLVADDGVVEAVVPAEGLVLAEVVVAVGAAFCGVGLLVSSQPLPEFCDQLPSASFL